MAKNNRRRNLKTYSFRVYLEGSGELKAQRPISQKKILKMAREKLDLMTDGKLKGFTMGVSSPTLVKPKKSGKAKKPKKHKLPKLPKKSKKGKGRKTNLKLKRK